MTIDSGKVVTLQYALYDTDSDTLVESSDDANPLAYLHGYNNIISGLEKALTGKTTGDEVSVTLAPAEAYGERQEDALQRLPIKHLRHAGKLRPGMRVTLNTKEGERIVTVAKVGLKTVDVDTNHPLAGKTLRFELSVMDVRDASDEEKAHRHVHGAGGHHH
ncbi:MAG: peptidylprolyl isomerase [Marinobacter sp.]|nr:peptidylprolyl isomerase [Marinobacter sp.]